MGAASPAASSLYFLAPGYVPAWVGVGIDLALAAVALLTTAARTVPRARGGEAG